MKATILWGSYMVVSKAATKSSHPRSQLGLRVVDLLQQGDPETGIPWSHSQIAAMVGLTRERVRQLALKFTGETGRQRQARRCAIRSAAQPKPPKRMTRQGWLTTFKRWLTESGYAYCTAGRHVVPAKDIAKTCQYRCNACVAAETRKWYATPDGKAKCLQWQAANPDKVAEYIGRYWRSPKGKAKSRRSYLKRKAKKENHA